MKLENLRRGRRCVKENKRSFEYITKIESKYMNCLSLFYFVASFFSYYTNNSSFDNSVVVFKNYFSFVIVKVWSAKFPE